MNRRITTPATWAALIGSISVFVFANTWWLKAPALVCLVATVALIATRAASARKAV